MYDRYAREQRAGEVLAAMKASGERAKTGDTLARGSTTGRQHWCASAQLWLSWKEWAAGANEHPGSRKRFGTALEGHGFAAEKSQGVRGFRGLNRQASDEPDYASRYD
jgi:hypothetical protein